MDFDSWYILTVDMVNVVDSDLAIEGLFPAKGKFVADAVGKCLWFGNPGTNN